MGKPIDIPNKKKRSQTLEDSEQYYNLRLRGSIPQNHIDVGPGLCPFDKRHNVHLILSSSDDFTPLRYHCSVCGYWKFASNSG